MSIYEGAWPSPTLLSAPFSTSGTSRLLKCLLPGPPPDIAAPFYRYATLGLYTLRSRACTPACRDPGSSKDGVGNNLLTPLARSRALLIGRTPRRGPLRGGARVGAGAGGRSVSLTASTDPGALQWLLQQQEQSGPRF